MATRVSRGAQAKAASSAAKRGAIEASGRTSHGPEAALSMHGAQVYAALSVALVALLVASACQRKPKLEDPLTVSKSLIPGELRDKLVERRVKPLAVKDASFSLKAPSDWREDRAVAAQSLKASLDEDVVPLVRFVPPEGAIQAALDVAYTLLHREISLRDFVDIYLSSHGVAVMVRKAAIWDDDPVEDLYVRDRQDASQVARLSFRKDGGHIWCVIGSTSEASYPELGALFGVAATSFEAKPRSPTPFAEAFNTYEAKDGIGPRFRWPSTWDLRPVADAPPGKGAADVVLEFQGVMRAILRVKWSKRDDVLHEPTGAQMLDKVSQELIRSGVGGQRLIAIEDVPDWKGAPPTGQVFSWEATLEEKPVAVRAVAFDTTKRAMSVSVLSPHGDLDPEAWGAAASAFEIAGDDVLEFLTR